MQVEDIEKPPFEINDNTDDVMEPQPPALKMPPSRRSQDSRYLASDVISAHKVNTGQSVRGSIERQQLVSPP